MVRWQSFLRICAVLVAALFLCASAIAADREELRKKVESLASPNAPPKVTGGPRSTYKLQENFDLPAQKAVVKTWDELVAAGPEAFPYLIERFDDERYCTCVASTLTEVWHNWSVGDVCREIMATQLQPLGQWSAESPTMKMLPNRRPGRPNYSYEKLHTKVAAEEWWEEHEGKSLYKLQRTVLKWTIEEERQRGEEKYIADIEFLTRQLKSMKKDKEPIKWSDAGYSRIKRLGGKAE